MQTKVEKVSIFVHDYLMKTGKQHKDDPWGPKYRWEHTLRVASWARLLAVEEKTDVEKCVIAALLHDISHFVSEDYRKHGIRSAEIARNLLTDDGYKEDFIEHVAYAVESHVGEANPNTVEAKILQDADTLDRFGYIRILLFGKTVDLSNLENLKAKVQSFLEYLMRVERGDFGRMWTKTGETQMRRLTSVSKTVFEGVLEELEKTKTPETYLQP